jgi:hypothetical protein
MGKNVMRRNDREPGASVSVSVGVGMEESGRECGVDADEGVARVGVWV